MYLIHMLCYNFYFKLIIIHVHCHTKKQGENQLNLNQRKTLATRDIVIIHCSLANIKEEQRMLLKCHLIVIDIWPLELSSELVSHRTKHWNIKLTNGGLNLCHIRSVQDFLKIQRRAGVTHDLFNSCSI